VSVVVPARDAADTIATQIGALADQEVDVDWELVVVDNGSTDDTAAVAAAALADVPAARVVAADRGTGAAFARNVGARQARGDFLVFCDADDRVAPGWLAALVAGAEHTDALSGTVDLTSLNPPALAAGHDSLTATRADGAGRPPLFGVVLNGNTMGLWRDAFEAVDGFDEAFRGGGEDKDLGYRLAAAGYEVAVCPDAVVDMGLRTRWSDRVRQHYRRGHEDVALYRRFAADGYPPRGLGAGVRTAAGLGRDTLRLRDPAMRVAWWNRAARLAGRARGSVRYRVCYL